MRLNEIIWGERMDGKEKKAEERPWHPSSIASGLVALEEQPLRSGVIDQCVESPRALVPMA